MVTRIPRHEFLRTDHAEELMAPVVENAKDVLDHVETSEDDRYDALSATLAVAKWRCLTNPTAGEFPTWEAWVTAMQIGCGLFAAGTAAEGPVACRVGSEGGVKNLPATGPQDYLHAGNWLTSFYLAVICRENGRVDQLAQVPVSFLRASGAEFDEYVYAWVETLQNLWFGRREVWDTLATAIDGTAPEAAPIAGPELMLKILYPPTPSPGTRSTGRRTRPVPAAVRAWSRSPRSPSCAWPTTPTCRSTSSPASTRPEPRTPRAPQRCAAYASATWVCRIRGGFPVASVNPADPAVPPARSCFILHGQREGDSVCRTTGCPKRRA